jgi:hypothetical protein
MRRSIELLASLLFCGCTATAGPSHDGQPASVGGSGNAGGSGSTWTPGAPQPSVVVSTPRLVRLSRLQWENSVRDLLQLADVSDVTGAVTGDALVGFDTEAEALRVGEQLRADLEKASRALAERVVADPAALARLVPAAAPTDLAGKSRAFIVAFGMRAFRRPLTDAEITTYVTLFGKGAELYPGEDAFTAGVKVLVVAILQSPHFLYRTELTAASGSGPTPLSDYEVAAKLALALTNTLPDATLLAAAAAGGLRTPEQVGEHAARLLSSEPGGLGRDHFHFQAYRLGTYDGISRSATAFPEFTAQTPAAMRTEVLEFLRYVFDQGKGVAGVFTTPVGFVNAQLAPLYGLPSDGYTTEFKQVELDPTQRAGLLTLPGFLSSFAVVDDPDTIRRGVFINQRILCRELPPPDPNATVLKPLSEGMTNRERVEATTGPGTCGQGCHSTVINPPGFAFEGFDAVGKYRTTDRGKPIDASAAYQFDEGLKSFNGPVEFSRLLAESPQAHACYIESWMSYVLGHPLAEAEKPLLEYFTHASLNGELSMKELLVELTTADGFLKRLP